MVPAGFATDLASERPGGFRKRDYQQLRAGLTFTPALVPTLAVLTLDAGLLLLAAHLLAVESVASWLLAQVLLAIVFFHAFAVLHECGHGTVSKRRWVNTLIGHLTSGFCFIPYFPWKYIHQKHHAWAGSIEHDPVLKALRSWRGRKVPWIVRAAWWSWIPLGALVQHLVYLTYPLAMWRAGELTPAKALRTVGSLVWLALSPLASWWLAPDLVRPQNVLPAIALFLVMEELVNVPHHVDVSTFDTRLALWEQHRATRSCYYPAGLSELLVLNFNFHIEHHLFPDLPWHRLRYARRLVKDALGPSYREAVGIAWNIENRRRDLQRIVDGSSVGASPQELARET